LNIDPRRPENTGAAVGTPGLGSASTTNDIGSRYDKRYKNGKLSTLPNVNLLSGRSASRASLQDECFMLPPVAGAVARPAQLVRKAVHSGTRRRKAASGHRTGRSGLLVDRFALSQAPRITMYSGPVSNEPRLEPTLSVVWQSCSVAVQHLLQRWKRFGGCPQQALGAR